MKLELKHLAPYLPYGLTLFDTSQEECIFDAKEWLFRDKQFVKPFFKNHLEQILNDDSLKLILRPLSDLRKEEYFDSFFAFCENELIVNPYFLLEALEKGKYFLIDFSKYYKIEEFMNKNHFDWRFNLIENGLAINKNDIIKELQKMCFKMHF